MDGLRAVAVTAVLLYHLDAPWLPGGFLGVDLFFVLSGFLITTLLLREAGDRGRIALAAFWVRRARRLLPLALLVVTTVMVVGWATTDPSELGALRADGLWTLFYGANWHLIGSGQSYFAAFAAPSPLRHAWSLAVEEQFYLVWPMVVLSAVGLGRRLARRRPDRSLLVLAVVIAVGAVVSATLMAVHYSPADPSRAYYGTDTRAQGLLIGAGAAVLLLGPRAVGWGRLLERFAPVAAVLVLVALAWVPDDWVGYYRGGAALFAVAAGVVVAGVAAQQQSPLARLLGWTPLVWVGRLSYGIYLWHWPVYRWLEDAWVPTGPVAVSLQTAAKIALTLGLSVVSYYLVERPVRAGRIGSWRLTARRVAVLAPVSIAAVVAVTMTATAAATSPALAEPHGVEALMSPHEWVDASSDTGLRLATVGDSVTRSLAPGLAQAAKARGWAYTDASVSSCSVTGMLLLDTFDQPWPTGSVCPQTVPEIQRRLVADDHPDVVLVHSRWETYRVQGPDGQPLDVNTPAHRAYVADQLRIAMTRLTAGGARVVWIDSTPMTASLCRRLGHPATDCAHTATDPTVDDYTALRQTVAAEFAGRVTAISLTDLLCTGQRCPDQIDGRELRPDGLHFTTDSAEWIAPELLRRVEAVTALH